MKCSNCGRDSEGKFCIFCGSQLNGSVNSTKNININNKKSDADTTKDKLPFHLQMWFIILIFFVTGCIMGIPGIILLILRIKNYPQKRTPAFIFLGLVIFITITVIATSIYAIRISTEKERTIEKYIESGEYETALEYLDNNYNATDFSYYTHKADIYVASGDYDNAAQAIIDYCNLQPALDSLPAGAESRLVKYKDKVSEIMADEIQATLEKIKADKVEKEKNDKEKEELKAAAEAAKKEAETAKAQAKKAEEDAKKAQADAKKVESEVKEAEEYLENIDEEKKHSDETNKEIVEDKTDNTGKNNVKNKISDLELLKFGSYISEDGLIYIKFGVMRDFTTHLGLSLSFFNEKTKHIDAQSLHVDVKSGDAERQDDGTYSLYDKTPEETINEINGINDSLDYTRKNLKFGGKNKDIANDPVLNLYTDGESIYIIKSDGNEIKLIYDDVGITPV